MKIYIVIHGFSYEGYELEGVFIKLDNAVNQFNEIESIDSHDKTWNEFTKDPYIKYAIQGSEYKAIFESVIEDND